MRMSTGSGRLGAQRCSCAPGWRGVPLRTSLARRPSGGAGLVLPVWVWGARTPPPDRCVLLPHAPRPSRVQRGL